ncbi:hypothetical protein BC835DRAFT_1397748 [Cytidiella melzeri]|nr:hypothetical protein BC835DRAFT_1397748 [Cytidiella melzeri]
MSSIFSNLKRKSRSRTKTELTSPSKAKPLDILPGLTEADEEEPRPSASSIISKSSFPSTSYLSPTYCASRSLGGSNTLGTGARNSRIQDAADRKRDSRRVVLTGAEGLTFEDFFPMSGEFRAAPSPLQAVSPPPEPRRPVSEDPFAVIESPLDSINFRFSGLHLQFDVPTTPSSQRSQSPTPSVASSRTTASSSSTTSAVSRSVVFTPPTSDDESQAKPHPYSNLNRAPTHKSQRASIMYMKSMPDLQRPIRKRECTVLPREEDDSDSEDVYWFAQELSDIITMLPSVPETKLGESRRARPDSVFPPPRAVAGHNRHSKALPNLPLSPIQRGSPRGPSAQLDPTFPQRKRHAIPSRPPPPPPILIESPPSPTMEEKTDELLALLANAAMDMNFLGTGLGSSFSAFPPSLPVTPSSAFAVMTPLPVRPPPRSSIPADINDVFDDAHSPEDREMLSDEHDDGLEFEFDDLSSPEWPSTPKSTSIYSQASMSLDTIPVEIATPTASHSGFDCETPVSPAMPESPFVGMCASDATQRVLRSRWSSSTLSSLIDSRQAPLSPASWKLRFNLGSSPSPTKKCAKVKTSSNRPLLKTHQTSTPLSPAVQKSVTLERRESSSSRMSDSGSDSGESTASSGLRRKPIPVEIFMRA